MSYARMVIGEAQNDEMVRQFEKLWNDDLQSELKANAGLESARLLIEEGGRMAVCLTIWTSRDACLKYHSSRSYRQFVAKTQHMLVGNFVVKLFKTEVAA